jgi:superfamily II DNA/RNA helicase
VRRYDSRTVGLLTGDNSINGDAPVVVMTTEVLRNMLYTGSLALSGLGYVVLDEVHYLADRSRGAVWEEVIIHLPESVRVVALSATVSNAEEFGEWLDQVRGGTEVIVDEHRPVPLWQHVLAGHRLYDLFTEDEHTRVNPELLRVAQRDTWIERKAPQRPGRGGHRPRRFPPAYRPDVISRLDSNGLLPAITFIFSRAGCDAAVEQCLVAGLRLTTPEEAEVIQQVAERHTADIPPEDLTVLGYGEWLEGLRRGIAAHHAGMLPAFKEVVEELFAAGLVRAVFATETLALGINMPARTVVIEKLDKWNGETHANLTAGEYTQLTGRAGRRGIDVEGHAVVLWQPGMDPGAVAGLASTRTYPLNSSFRPSYNMAVNLTGWAGRARAATLLESSFAQFQADRGVVGLTRQVRKNRQAMDELAAAMSCDKGDFAEYAQLRRSLTEREGDLSRVRASSRRAEAARSLAHLRPGDIIRVPGGRRAGLAVVLQPGLHAARGGNGNGRPADRGAAAPAATTAGARTSPARPGCGQRRPARVHRARSAGPHRGRQVKRLAVADFPVPAEVIDKIRIPGRSARSPQHRKDLAATMQPASQYQRNQREAAPGTRGRLGAGRARGHGRYRGPAATASASSVPRLPGPREPRPVRRTLHAAEAGDRGARAPGGRPVARDRPHLRPGVPCPGTPRLPDRGHRHAGRAAARPPVHRAGPAGRRVPAPRPVGRSGPRPSSPPACPPCPSSRARPTTSSRPGCRSRCPRPSPPPSAPGASSTSWRRTTTCRSCASPTPVSPGPPTAGRAARLESVLDEAPDLTPGDFVRSVKAAHRPATRSPRPLDLQSFGPSGRAPRTRRRRPVDRPGRHGPCRHRRPAPRRDHLPPPSPIDQRCLHK